ncbi:SDR family oxidoreductase [Streptomyces termitum]|uniref:NAD(P)-dependent oxidoreductase n=1 Tax=Streptomyces termitum TaxID=67368 RepID=A0A918WC09_9ACTN|nr:sugar nucleotide-binding protein [Streptomyces termitum]GHA90335.1 NAD(P)-dependent oxidoreductase [Streptomyces termitum]
MGARTAAGGPVLVVGSGFVGTETARRLAGEGRAVTLASRGRPASPPEAYGAGWTALDATDPAACARVVAEVRPRAVVLVHGPSDVTWCEAHPVEAARAHAAATASFAALPGLDRLVMISTDNVFDGVAPVCVEESPTAPANAYGAAKLRAEELLLARAVSPATVLRVSLVYGHEPADAGKWLNFFASCAHRLLRGEPVEAPDDQWTTPVPVADVAAVTALLLRPGAAVPELLHLGGPERVSRAGWAREIARALGVPEELVRPVPRASGRYASRPENTCLASTRLGAMPGMEAVALRGVAAAARELAGAFGRG